MKRLVSALLLAGCTLTADEFEPEVARGEVRSEPSGGAAQCPAGRECCEGVECPSGEACEGGRCAAAAAPCTGADCSPLDPIPLTPSCSDGIRNGNEPHPDCGGECERRCELGQRCDADSDCELLAFCPSGARVCTLPSCIDGVRNGDETDLDCGGGCAGCGAGAECNQPSDCASGVCSAARCAAPSCTDRVRNGVEPDVDCGGPCPVACTDASRCEGDADCQSGVCGPERCAAGVSACCQPPTCSDGVPNGDEPVVDCGNLTCGPCALGAGCVADANCLSGFCAEGRCADPGRCDDGIVNGRESSTDCGGGTCPRCPDLSECREDSDCVNNNCDERGICISCGDATINGTETDFDCGGVDPFCQRCRPGQRCLIGSDCASGLCFGGFC